MRVRPGSGHQLSWHPSCWLLLLSGSLRFNLPSPIPFPLCRGDAGARAVCAGDGLAPLLLPRRRQRGAALQRAERAALHLPVQVCKGARGRFARRRPFLLARGRSCLLAGGRSFLLLEGLPTCLLPGSGCVHAVRMHAACACVARASTASRAALLRGCLLERRQRCS